MHPSRRLFLAIVFAATSVEAQPFTIPTFDFSFSNPGARSLGFGGAFAALADDATAAYANPAGLVQLTEPEVSVEGRLWQRSPQFIAGGRADGVPTGRGIDTWAGIVFERDESQDLGPSFASVVIPKGRWSFALYGHQLARFEMQSDYQGIFSEADFFPSLIGIRSPGSRESTDLEVVTAGASAAWRMNDRLSFGLGLVFSDVSLATSSGAYLPDDDSEQSQYAAISYLPERRLTLSTLSIDGTDVTFNAGALWRMSERFSGGLFYRQGAEVEGTSVFEVGPLPVFPGFPPFEGTFRNEAVFKIPDVGGIGLAYRSSDGAITIATQIDVVRYGTPLRIISNEDLEADSDSLGESVDYHIGAEYALLRSTPILAFRAGAWVESNGFALLETDEVTHLSAGLGAATAVGQIDLAADFSERGDTASLSFIYNF